jgi:hypothetical protein
VGRRGGVGLFERLDAVVAEGDVERGGGVGEVVLLQSLRVHRWMLVLAARWTAAEPL